MITELRADKHWLLYVYEFDEILDGHAPTRPQGYGGHHPIRLFPWKKTKWWKKLFLRKPPYCRRALAYNRVVMIQYADEAGIAFDHFEQRFG